MKPKRYDSRQYNNNIKSSSSIDHISEMNNNIEYNDTDADNNEGRKVRSTENDLSYLFHAILFILILFIMWNAYRLYNPKN